MNKLQKGDTIQCHDCEDMIRTSTCLAKEGVFTDWLDIKEQPPLKWRFTITGFERETK